MVDALLIGFGGLVVLVALIALRMPIAYAMILVGGFGVTILNGPAIFMSQLKTLAYGQFSIYDLSVVPMRETFLGVMPFFLAEIVRVAVILAFPAIVFFLPNLLSG